MANETTELAHGLRYCISADGGASVKASLRAIPARILPSVPVLSVRIPAFFLSFVRGKAHKSVATVHEMLDFNYFSIFCRFMRNI
jgi:hypothetical protein